MKIKVIAYDLDDTLIDTSGLLIPNASKNACQSLIDQGLKAPLEKLLELRHHWANQMSHRSIFKKMCLEFQGDPEWSQAAIQEFYAPEIPAVLPLMDEAEEVLNQLHGQYALYLVTSGIPDVQRKKLEATGARKYFKKCYWVDSMTDTTKKNAFLEIIKSENIQSNELLVFGNRLSSEIREGKRAGATTCYLAYGEHVLEKPTFPEDFPDFEVKSHKEMKLTCQL